MNNKKYKIAVVGLGYVGLPLAIEFSKKFKTIGFDINEKRVGELRKSIDSTLEVDNDVLAKNLKIDINSLKNSSSGFYPTCHPEDISSSNIYIITVPTPTDNKNKPVFAPLISASKTVGKFLKKDDIVIYESTVYPGATEEICIPILEESSSMKLNLDFFVGYSPERINPGDKNRTLAKIMKVTSGSNKKSAQIIDSLYKTIITAGTHMAPNIKVAEAAKVIENSQRDINIAFVNELAKIFNKLNINTKDVLDAAKTKWNFLPFEPGLVGGHCIGVDPYYLANKAQEVGYHPEIILAGRRLNDSMGEYIATEFVKLALKKKISIKKAKVLILGITFKENCPDIRNTKVIDIINQLKEYGVETFVHDPCANIDEVYDQYGINLHEAIPNQKFDGIIIAVAHKNFKEINFKEIKKEKSVLLDVKGILGDVSDYKL